MNALVGLMAFQNLAAFMAGIAVTVLYYRWKDHVADTKDPDHAPHHTHFKVVWLAGVITASMILFIGIRTQTAANEAEKAQTSATQLARSAEVFASQVQDCQRQFNNALTVRSEVNTQNEELATRERNALRNMVTKLLAESPLLTKEQSDAAGRDILRDYNDTVAQTETQRAANDAARAHNQLPEPNCGLTNEGTHK